MLCRPARGIESGSQLAIPAWARAPCFARMASPFQKLAFKAGLIALVLGVAAVLWWLCDQCGSIAFLPGRPGAEWIVTPHPLEARKRETVRV